MPFYLYKKQLTESKEYLFKQERNIQLAGRQTIHSLWNAKNKPRGGWSMSADELIKTVMQNNGDSASHSIIIDLAPGRREIAFYELTDIWAYTYFTDGGQVNWTPLMLKLKEIVEIERRNEFRQSVNEQPVFCYEFLYLQGENGGWRWGRNGSVNGALLYSDAFEYFQHFIKYKR